MQGQGVALLKAAWDLGINTVDTANSYSNGESERIIGQFMIKVCGSIGRLITVI
jgi:aryl-alcohol dehydrogenase-like predicted oxidoreductase